MASVPSAQEIQDLLAKMEKTRERVRDNPKEARRVLHAAGIVTRTGKLKKPYSENITE